MEEILRFVFVLFGLWLLGQIVGFVFRLIAALAKSLFGSGSLGENLAASGLGSSTFQARLVHKAKGEGGIEFERHEVEARGQFPIPEGVGSVDLGVMISVLDRTQGELAPVYSMDQSFREPASYAYLHAQPVGQVLEGQGFASWCTVGVVIPELLHPPRTGNRDLVVQVRLVDVNTPPLIMEGVEVGSDGRSLWAKQFTLPFSFPMDGWMELIEKGDEMAAVTIKVAMAVAMADGSLDDAEGALIKEWVKKRLAGCPDARRDELKALYNTAMREAHEQARRGELSLSRLVSELNERAGKSAKYDTVQLCFGVMAADGVAEPRELEVVKKVSSALGLDDQEHQRLIDQHLPGVVANSNSLEQLLGIDPNWDRAKIRRHLAKEFGKWNPRLNALPEGKEREAVQATLERIAEARKKYA